MSATAAASALLAACSSSSSNSSTGTVKVSDVGRYAVAGNFPQVPAWQFWFVNHVTTNLFFVPTQFGFADAAALLGIPKPKWTGSTDSAETDMVSAINNAVAAKANGIATCVINSAPTATTFQAPVASAMNAGIPVVSYNADGPIVNGVVTPGTNRLCYVGQALYLSGQQMGERIKSLAKPGEIVIFIATPGTANIQPRYDGAASVLTPAGYSVKMVATGATTARRSARGEGVPARQQEHHRRVRGGRGLDRGTRPEPGLPRDSPARSRPAGST